MSTERRVTFCRICEAACGMVATVEDDRVVALRPASIDVEVRADLVARDENDFARQQEQLLFAAMAHAEALGLTFADPHALNVTLPRPAAD